MSQTPDRRVDLATAPNMRGLGGLPVAGGTVREGLIYRSATLANLSEADGRAFEQLGIETVFDLRTTHERAEAPDRVPSSIADEHLDVLADSKLDVAAGMATLMKDPQAANELLAGGKAQEMLKASYEDIVFLPSAVRAYRRFFAALTAPDYSTSLFHCTTGKDRTGWAAVTFLSLLGADDATVRADYLQTNTDLLPSLQPMIDQAAAAGIDTDALLPLLTVSNDYLDEAIEGMHEGFGSFEDYGREALGLTEDRLEILRTRFIAS